MLAPVIPEILEHTWQELDYRLDICRATHGAHVEPAIQLNIYWRISKGKT